MLSKSYHRIRSSLELVVHPLSGTRWTLKHYTVALLVDLNADLKHYFSVRHSVARLELSASASEVIRHAGLLALYKLDYYYYFLYYFLSTIKYLST